MDSRTQCKARSGAYGDGGAVKHHGSVELLLDEIRMVVLELGLWFTR